MRALHLVRRAVERGGVEQFVVSVRVTRRDACRLIGRIAGDGTGLDLRTAHFRIIGDAVGRGDVPVHPVVVGRVIVECR
jgi:hypothetical protein